VAGLACLASAFTWEELSTIPDLEYATDLARQGEVLLVGGNALDTSNFLRPLRSRIALSTDGGRSFRAVQGAVGGEATSDEVQAVAAAGQTLLAGRGRTVLRSTDGGTTWAASEAPMVVNALHLNADGTGFAVGDGGGVATTADGGATWQAVTSPTTLPLRGMAWRDARVGWAWGHQETRSNDRENPGTTVGQGVLIATDDGGQSWEQRQAFDSVVVGPAFPISATDGFVATARRTSATGMAAEATLLATTDGARTVRPVPLPDNVGLLRGPFNTRSDLTVSWIRGMYWQNSRQGHLVALAHLFDRQQGSGGGGQSSTRSESGFRIIDLITEDGGQTWLATQLGELTSSFSGVDGPNDGEIVRAAFESFYDARLVGSDGRVWTYRTACTADNECVAPWTCERGGCVAPAGGPPAPGEEPGGDGAGGGSGSGGGAGRPPRGGGSDAGATQGEGSEGCRQSGGSSSAWWGLATALLALRLRRRKLG
jgi:hypothetical protein